VEDLPGRGPVRARLRHCHRSGPLVLSGTTIASGLPFYAILSLPVLFAAGICLFDTLDGCFMNFAYGWAFSKPIRKVYYNVIITDLSVAVAVVIGTIELVGLLTAEFKLHGRFWATMANFNINRGFIIVGMFVVTWAIALASWRFGYIEARWDHSADLSRPETAWLTAELEGVDA
jgi:high-affinity nickel-transport protein